MIKEKEVEQFYDSIAKNFEKYNNRFCDEILEYFILKFLPKKRIRILDAGGGIGRFAIPLAKKSYDITLSDISKEMLDKAKNIAKKNKIKNINFIKESITDMKGQKNNSFDAILIMNAILDYCGNHKKALKEIMRILKPNGILIGNVNNRFIYCSRHELKDGEINLFKRNMKTGNRYIIWDSNKGHWTHEFKLAELKEELQLAGFKIVKILGVFNLLGKYDEPKWLKDDKKRKELLKIQIEYAKKEDYINNSTDYFFVAKK